MEDRGAKPPTKRPASRVTMERMKAERRAGLRWTGDDYSYIDRWSDSEEELESDEYEDNHQDDDDGDDEDEEIDEDEEGNKGDGEDDGGDHNEVGQENDQGSPSKKSSKNSVLRRKTNSASATDVSK